MTGRADGSAVRGDRILAASGRDHRVPARADMSDLLRRIKRPRRTPAADPARGIAASEDVQAPLEASPGAGGPSPAGEDLTDRRPSTLSRGRLRKRLRFLDRERELLLRDLGGLVYEIHRNGSAADRERHRTLVAEKVSRLNGLDAELESGLAALGEARRDTVLREPGIGGLCPRCGDIHGSDARFCSACGFPLEVARTPGAPAPSHGHAPAAADRIVVTPPVEPIVTTPSVQPTAPTAPVRETAVTAPVDPVAPVDPSSPAAAAAIDPAAEDSPTQVISHRPAATAPGEDTAELPPSDSGPR